MVLPYILIGSAAITLLILYAIRWLSTEGERARRLVERERVAEDEEILEDVEERFEGRIYRSAEKTRPRTSRYPECFGTAEIYASCNRKCGVDVECGSTIKVLQGF